MFIPKLNYIDTDEKSKPSFIPNPYLSPRISLYPLLQPSLSHLERTLLATIGLTWMGSWELMGIGWTH